MNSTAGVHSCEQTFASCVCNLNLTECHFLHLQCYTSFPYISEHRMLISTSSSPRQTTVGKCLLLRYPVSIRALINAECPQATAENVWQRSPLPLDRGSGKVWSFVACLCTNSLQGSNIMFLVTLTTAEDFSLLLFLCVSWIV